MDRLRALWWPLLHALPNRLSVPLRVWLYGREECAVCHVPAWLNPRWDHREWAGHEWVELTPEVFTDD